MKPVVYAINGRKIRPEEATLHVNDLSILRGYGVFDFFRTQNNRPFMMADHLQRFENSARVLGLDLPFSKEAIATQIEELIALNGFPETGIRLILTGGYAEDAFTPAKPNFLIRPEPFVLPPSHYFTEGIKLIMHAFQREFPSVKSTNYLTAIILARRCQAEGALDTLYHINGHLLEVTRSNIFLIKDGTIITPNKDMLFGITRKRVLELAKGHYEIEEREVLVQEIATADEAFMTGSTKKVMPVVQIESHVLGSGKPGPITQHLMARFAESEKQHQVENKQ